MKVIKRKGQGDNRNGQYKGNKNLKPLKAVFLPRAKEKEFITKKCKGNRRGHFLGKQPCNRCKKGYDAKF